MGLILGLDLLCGFLVGGFWVGYFCFGFSFFMCEFRWLGVVFFKWMSVGGGKG